MKRIVMVMLVLGLLVGVVGTAAAVDIRPWSQSQIMVDIRPW